jgi:fibronectin-binding autotransporter adhesin
MPPLSRRGTGTANSYTVANFITGSGKSLTFNGIVTQGDTGTARNLVLTGTGTTVFDGVMQNNTANLGLQVNMAGNVQYGPGTVRIGGVAANTFAGNAQLTAGITELAKVGSLTPLGTGSILFNTNSFLQSTVSMTGAEKLTNPTITFGNGTTASTGTIQGAQNIEFGGNVTNTDASNTLIVNNPSTVFSGATFGSRSSCRHRRPHLHDCGSGNTTIAGVVGNGATGFTGSLVKNGNGTLTLQSANTFTGGVTVNAGTLAASNIGAGVNQLGAAL